MVGNPYRFTGRRLDTETGLYYYRARHYSTEMGRFLSRDPIGIWGDAGNFGNAYAYAGNNPTFYKDPSGQKIEIVATDPEQYLQIMAAIAAIEYGFMVGDGGTAGDAENHKNGAELIKDLVEAPQVIYITTTEHRNKCEAGASFDDEGDLIHNPESARNGWKVKDPETGEYVENGAGTGCVIKWNPDKYTAVYYESEWGKEESVTYGVQERPPEIGIAHELIHAQELKNGEALWGTADDQHETVVPKENKIREEFKSEGAKQRVTPKTAKRIIKERERTNEEDKNEPNEH